MASENKELENYLSDLPGVGPRQAKRIIYSLLKKDSYFSNRLGDLIKNVRSNMRLCQETYHYFYSEDPNQRLSPIANDPNRDHSSIMVVENDSDMDNIEKSGLWRGTYFVLGGSIKPDTDPTMFNKRIRLQEFNNRLADNRPINEIILATSATVAGDFTSEVLENAIIESRSDITISHLARGISTGVSLEYVDPNTIASALNNRN